MSLLKTTRCPDSHRRSITSRSRLFLHSLLRRVSQRGIIGTVTVVVTGTAAGHVITVIASPVLTRIYSPNDFGTFGVYSSLLAIAVLFGTLRYDMGIPLVDDDEESIDLLNLSFLCIAITAIFLSVFIFIWGEWITTTWLETPSLTPYLWLLPISFAAGSTYQAINYTAVRQTKFSAIARSKLTQSIAQVITQIGLGLANVGAVGLLLGDGAGRTASSFAVARATLEKSRISKRFSLSRIIRVAARHKDLPTIILFSAFLNALAQQLYPILTPRYFGIAAAGSYFFVYRVLQIPAALLASSSAQVFLGTISNNRDDANAKKLITQGMISFLFTFSVPVYGGIMVAGVSIFRFIFGIEWESAGIYSQIVAPRIMLWMVASTISSLLLVGRRYTESFIFTFVTLLLTALAFACGVKINSFYTSILLNTSFNILLLLFSLWRFCRVVDVTYVEIFQAALLPTLISCPFFFILLGLAIFEVSDAFLVAVWLASLPIVVGFSFRFSPSIRRLLN